MKAALCARVPPYRSRMSFFQVDLAALATGAAAFDRHSASQRAIADTVQGVAQAPPAVGDVSAAAPFQQAWYDWVQTRFEDLHAAADVLAATGRRIEDTAAAYGEQDVAVADGLTAIGAALGAGPQR